MICVLLHLEMSKMINLLLLGVSLMCFAESVLGREETVSRGGGKVKVEVCGGRERRGVEEGAAETNKRGMTEHRPDVLETVTRPFSYNAIDDDKVLDRAKVSAARDLFESTSEPPRATKECRPLP